ncbi:insulin-degrading enzyme-like [Melanaphis sacchari]|uniref:insulin-degrading enzyme-like n=1 Tax=Melanaphis sacchari TaxID=742174 RepID=UPI000DC14473|nr:insulin-degrading enzyme-like [Melanaphis sacchari]
MIFMGTKKYPEENEFSQFITQNGGNFSAYTALDHTNYYCSAKTDSFEPLLDRFSRLFYEPLFTVSAAKREINSVNAEHENNKTNDSMRLTQLKRNMADPAHPFNMFPTGTKQTLCNIQIENGDHFCDKLLEYHSNWYSSNLMYLAVLGKADLDTLENMVSSFFMHIERKDILLQEWTDPIYKEEQLATKTIVVPVEDSKQLYINFLIKDQGPHYKSMPVAYLNSILCHKGPMSISVLLSNKGWSSGISAGKIFEARGIEYYEINMDLTELGLDYVDEIIKLIFKYVNMLKREGPQEWFYLEYKYINEMEFQYKDKEASLSYVFMLTPRMIRYKLEDVLTAGNLLEEWKPDLITELLSYFRPDNMRVTVVSKTFQNQTNAEDKYYGTLFKVSKIPVETINYWLEVDDLDDFKMPQKNRYITNNFSLVTFNDSLEFDTPRLCYNTSFLKCWLKKDTRFRLPKVYISIDFFSPIVVNDPFKCNIVDIFVRLFNQDFSSRLYDASSARLQFQIKSKIYGFSILLSGFNLKIHKLLKRVLERLMTINFSSQQIESIIEQKIRQLNNTEMEQPYNCAIRYNDVILTDAALSPSQLLMSISEINKDILQDFMKKFFSNMFMESLIYGNLDKRWAWIFVHELKRPFINIEFRQLLQQEMIRPREVKISDGENTFYEITTKLHSSSCVFVNLQCGIQNTKDNTVVGLFSQIIEDSCHNILRTQEQLGYVVMCVSYKSNGVLYFGIIVQSDHSPMFIHERIEHYLSTVESILNNLTDEEFLKNKESLSVKIVENPMGMMAQAATYWSEITNQHYNFNRGEIEKKMLTSITKKDILKFYYQKINVAGPKRHMLSVYVRSIMNKNPEEYSHCSDSSTSNNLFIPSNIQKIIDIDDFKRSHQLYPAPRRYLTHDEYSAHKFNCCAKCNIL